MTLIVEGCDGSGKTTLIQLIQNLYPETELHERFTRSIDGPFPDIAERVFRSTRNFPTHYIHDRHPVISEYVYGHSIPTRHVNREFLKQSMATVKQRIANNSLVIWCMPSLEVVRENVMKEPQMEGVQEYVDKIYEGYEIQRLFWRGAAISYDYTGGRSADFELAERLRATDGPYWRSVPLPGDSRFFSSPRVDPTYS
jgi:hypothetical protein